MSPGPRTAPTSTKIAVGSVVQQMNACAHLEGLDLSRVGRLPRWLKVSSSRSFSFLW